MDYYIENSLFDPKLTFTCGQCFRWTENPENGVFYGIASGKYIGVRKEEKGVSLLGVEESDIPFWNRYFDIDLDYAEINRKIAGDPVLDAAVNTAKGIRILRQEPFETLISFIISQNNNIPRISGIIARLCECFGKEIQEGIYSFPSAKELAELSENDLAPLRAGFRAKYILDAAGKVESREADLSVPADVNVPLDKARDELKKIKGVGDKIADCVLLFSFHRLDAFPKDVWIKRVIAECYPNGLPPQCTGEYAGIAQQYLFQYARSKKL